MQKLSEVVKWGIILTILLTLCLIIKVEGAEASMGFIPDTPEKVERLVEAIGVAENGKNWKSKGVKYPYGIKSIDTNSDRVYAKRIAVNTVKNNIKRWKKAKKGGYKGDYLQFLWERFCPPTAHALNKHWRKNVERGL